MLLPKGPPFYDGDEELREYRDVSGGWLRPAVFGAIDGVVTNSSLIAGIGGGGGGLDPVANEVQLQALQLDKAVYEVMYEARHRPSWLQIPLESLADFPE